MKVKCNIDRKSFSEKPTGKAIGEVQVRLGVGQVEIGLEELSKLLSTGCSFKPALLTNQDGASWVSQQIFALDFDHNTTIFEELARCEAIGLVPAFGYTSFSHMIEKDGAIEERFRLVFVMDQVITDKRIRNAVQIALLQAFPNADTSAKDSARLFFGGLNLITTNIEATLTVNDVIDKMVSTVKAESQKNSARTIEDYCSKVGLSVINGLPNVKVVNAQVEELSTNSIVYIEYAKESSILRLEFNITEEQASTASNNKGKRDTKFNITKEKTDFEYNRSIKPAELITKCELLQGFIDGTDWLEYKSIFGVASNMCQLVGGEELMLQGLNNVQYNNNRNNLSNAVKNMHAYNYLPQQCCNYCKYESTCEHSKNILQQSDHLRGSVRDLKNQMEVIPKTLKAAELELEEAFTEALNSDDTDVHIIKACAGLGKTRLYCKMDMENVMIAVPRHELLDQVAADLTANGSIFTKAIQRPRLLDLSEQGEIDKLTSIGLFKDAMEIFQRHVKSCVEKQRRLNNPLTVDEIKEYECTWGKYTPDELTAGELQAIAYMEVQKELPRATSILCTHAKTLFIENKKIKTVIIDEDPMTTVILQGGNMVVSELHNLRNFVNSASYLDKAVRESILGQISTVINTLEQSDPYIIHTMPKFIIDINELKKVIKQYAETISCNLINFLDCDFYTKSRDGSIIYKTNIASTMFKPGIKYIIMSATASELMYKKLLGDRLKFTDIGYVKPMGRVIQYTTNSYSRAQLRSHMDKQLDKITATVGDNIVITYKDIKDTEFLDYLEKKDIQQQAWFGNTTGLNKFEGRDIFVVGTPHLPTTEYLLTASCLGYTVKPSGQETFENQRVERNGYEFFFTTFASGILREIQFWNIESEIIQCYERARCLRTDATATILSNLPLPNVEILDKV